MALEKTFANLNLTLTRLRDDLDLLGLTLNDKPPRHDSALLDQLENSILDLVGMAQEAARHAAAAHAAVRHAPDVGRVRRHLDMCQQSFNGIQQKYSDDLGSYGKLSDLAAFGKTRQGEWSLWARAMKRAIDNSRHPLAEASGALADCWKELTEHLGGLTISVKAREVESVEKLYS